MAVTKWKPGATTLATNSYHQLPATRRGRHRHRHIRSPLPAAWAGLGECHNNFLRFQQIPASSETRSRLTSYAGMSSWFNWDARYYLRFSNLHISSLQLEMLKIFFLWQEPDMLMVMVGAILTFLLNAPLKLSRGHLHIWRFLPGWVFYPWVGRHQDPACDLYLPSLPAAATMLTHSLALLLLLATVPAHRYLARGRKQDILCRYLDHGVI